MPGHPLELSGATGQYSRREGEGCCSQAGIALAAESSPDRQKELFENTRAGQGRLAKEIKVRHIGGMQQSDPACGQGVARALRIPMSSEEVGKS